MKLLATFLLLAAACHGAIAYVNNAVGVDNSGSSITSKATASWSSTTGNLNVVCVRTAGGTVSSITDTASNTYTNIAGFAPAGDRLEIWYAKNTTGNASNVVTANFSSTNFVTVLVMEYSGADTSAPLDTSATSSSTTSTTVTSNSFTTTAANEVLVACAQVASVSVAWSAGSGYTKRYPSSGNTVVIGEDNIVSSVQTGVTATATTTGANNKTIIVATFKDASQPAGGATPSMLLRGVGAAIHYGFGPQAAFKLRKVTPLNFDLTASIAIAYIIVYTIAYAFFV